MWESAVPEEQNGQELKVKDDLYRLIFWMKRHDSWFHVMNETMDEEVMSLKKVLQG